MSDQRYHMDGPGNDQRRPGYDQRRRARMRAMRRRKVRRQRMIVAAVFALLVLLISVLAVRAYQSAQDRKRAEAVRSALAVCFEETVNTAEFNQVISEASKECDYLIAYIHWGPEDEEQYADYQTEEGKEFLASGADIVVGSHPHVLEGIEYTDDGPIVYSMGDFWFNDETKYTGLLNLKIDADGLDEMSFTPCQQRDYTTQYLEGKEEQREMFDFLEGLSPNISIDDNGVITKAQE